MKLQNEKQTNKLNIWIYGSGAVGGFYGSKLIDAGHRVTFIARGKQLQALKKNGLTIKSPTGSQNYCPLECYESNDLKDCMKPDLVMVSVKTYSNQEVIPILQKVLDEDIPIFVLQNGIRSQEIYKKELGSQRVFRVIMNISSSLEQAGTIIYKSGGAITFEKGHQVTEILNEAFLNMNLESKISDDIEFEAWYKILWNAPFNSVTALSRLSTKPIIEDTDGLKLIKEIAKEVCILANSCGINLTEEHIKKKIDYTINILGDITSSTREDVLENKPIEYEAVVGDLLHLARERKIEVPYLETVFTLLKLLDKSFKDKNHKIKN